MNGGNGTNGVNGTIRYSIRPYDTIWMLSQIFNTTVDSIIELNPGIDPRNLMIGQVITLQPGLQYYPSFSDIDGEDEDMNDRNNMPGRSGTNQGTTMPSRSGTNQGTTMPGRSGTNQGTTMPGRSGTNQGTTMPSGSGMNQGTTMPGGSGMNQGMTMPGGSGMNQGMTMPGRSGTNQGTTMPSGSGMNQGTTMPGRNGMNQGTTMPGRSGMNQGTTMPGGNGMNQGTTMPGGSGMNRGNGMNVQNNYNNNEDNYNMNTRRVISEDDDYENMMDPNVEELVSDFRKLWEQHVEWTRMAIMGIVHDLPETDLIIQRLLRNPLDFAAAMQPFYGDEVAKNFANLLTEHLMIAAELVRAAKAGNSSEVSDADRRWRQNADEMADFLAGINSEWNEEDWNAMLDEHLDLLSKNVADMLSGDYEESIQGFDDIENQALEMADVMADGVMMQFMD